MRLLCVLCLPLWLLLCAPVQAAAPAPDAAARIAALEKKSGGRIGVAVATLDGRTLLGYRAQERFAMCSTFKALLGAAVLARVDAGQERLERDIAYRASDLLEYAPVTTANLGKGAMSIAALNAASIQVSDNTAANLLLDTIGGPAALTAWLRQIGDTTTRLDRNEPALNSNLDGDERDTSTPAAMTATLRKLVDGSVLSPASTEQLKAWLIGNTTGDARLRAGFASGWIVGDKTGTGAQGATNDMAVVYPRGSAAFVITVFYTGSQASGEERSAVLAEVARISAAALPRQRRRQAR